MPGQYNTYRFIFPLKNIGRYRKKGVILSKDDMIRSIFIIVFFGMFIFSCRDACRKEKLLHKEISEIGDCLKDSTGSVEYFYSNHMEHFYEYRGGLINAIGQLKDNDSVKVKEVEVKHGDTKIYIWFRQKGEKWYVIDVLNIPPGTSY